MINTHKKSNHRWLLLAATFFTTLLTFQSSHSAGAVTFELSNAAAASQGYLSNTIIDFVRHGSGVWGATSKGLSFTNDGGLTWQYFTSTNSSGLVSDNVSALYSAGSRLWVATNHNVDISGGLVSASDGVAYSDNDGLWWTQIDFETAPNDIPYVWGGDRTIFDITGYSNGSDKDYLFFSAFAGGFLGSADGGTTWTRVFPSRSDSAQFYNDAAPSLRNRYFSCVADSSHGDTVMIYAGTAGGLLQYSFVDKHDKPYSRIINAVAFRDENIDTSDNYVFIGGTQGLTRGRKKGNPYLSRFAADGLTNENVTALIDFRGRLIVGTMHLAPDSTANLLISDDRGMSFASPLSYSADGTGPDTKISAFASIRERLYLAAKGAGWFVSTDSGSTWTQLYIDSTNVSSLNSWNTINDLDALGDTLRIATDSGLATIYMNAAGDYQSVRRVRFPENSSSSTRVMKVETQTFYTSSTFDSLAIWTVNRPLAAGVDIVARSVGNADTSFGSGYKVGITVNDLGFLGDTALVAGPTGIGLSDLGGEPIIPYYIKKTASSSSSAVVDSLTLDTITVIESQGDTMYVGTRSGFAYTLNHGTTWNIVRINQSPVRSDFVAAYYVGINGISGDWFPALGVQTLNDQPYPLIWATSRPTYSGYDGISVGWMRPVTDSTGADTLLYRLSWNSVYEGVAWNYAFDGKTIYAATDDGLITTHADSVLYADTVRWDTIALNDENGDPLLLPGTAVYAVAVVDSFLWVGTGDRTVRIHLNDSSKTAYHVTDSSTPADEVYAFPIPFSGVRGQALDFHFQVTTQAEVTIEIYDFAMNLVRRVIDNVTYPPGIYPTSGSLRKTWDGRNGNGDLVAVGMYYFKVSLSTGDVRWGKIAVIP